MSTSLLGRLPKYYKKFSLCRFHRTYVTCTTEQQQQLQVQSKVQEHSLDPEYTTKPNYPPIVNNHHKAKFIRRREEWYERMKTNAVTVEEKLIAINLPRYYGYKCLMLNDTQFRYNCLPLIQCATRTVLNDINEMPAAYDISSEQMDSFVQTVKSDIEDAILFEFTGYTPNINKIYDPEISTEEKSRKRSSDLIGHINRALTNALITDAPHLQTAECDIDPRHEAFWMVGGFDPPTNIVKMRKGTWQKTFAEDSVDRQFQYVGTPFFTLRHKHPLRQFEDFNQNPNQFASVPQFQCDPRTIGYTHDYRHGTTIPGFWPGSPNQFGLVSYHSRNYMADRNPDYGADDNQEALHAQGILCSFAWLYGQAAYQGFTTLNDITYPLTTQTILTDGQFWSFYAYQLNTTVLNCDSLIDPTTVRVNKCWGTNEMKLFDEIDGDGKLVNFNDSVLRHLVKFYLNQPEKRVGTKMRPFLSRFTPYAARIPSKYAGRVRREFIESHYKHLMANRERHLLVPEVYNWEKIYKIDNDTKPLDAKRRFFELSQNPFTRRLDDHTSVYIPKYNRKNGPKSRIKFEKMFYPKV